MIIKQGCIFFLSCLTGLCLLANSFANVQRIEDLTSIQGVRSNPLIGYGLVVGLDGSGDSANFTNQTIKNMLVRLGVTLPLDAEAKSKNVASVIITAELPPFARPGQRIDVTVSSLGDSKSLRGGTLLMTPLKGADGNVYALAQGNVVVGGFSAEGTSGSSVIKNTPSVGRIANGASVEQSVPTPFALGSMLTLQLERPNFTTAKRIAQTINEFLGSKVASPIDAAAVSVSAPDDTTKRVNFISVIQGLQVKEGEGPAKVVVNSRTGTIVIGQNVRLTPTAISHGDLVVSITETSDVSQPEALSDGATVVTPQSNVVVTEDNSKAFILQPGPTLRDIVQAINQVGATPQDLVSILEALKEAGALHAELIVI